MQINRNNYEEYFLLYIDGELSNADKAAVEQFVKLHPDLEEELQLLQETVMSLDGIIEMPGKESLLKQVEWQEEDITTTREELMQYVDDELPVERRLELEKELANDIVLRSELASLEKTKLLAEAVVMPSKENLYRYESDRKPVPIRSIGWTRWVAAAATIAGIAWVSFSLVNNQTTEAIEPGTVAVTKKEGSSVNTATNTASTTTTEVAEIAPEVAPVEAPVKSSTTVQYAVNDIASATKKDNHIYQNTVQTEPVKKIQPDIRDRSENVPYELAVMVPPTGIVDGKQADRRKIGAPDVNTNIVVVLASETDAAPTTKETSPYQYASYDDYADVESEYVNIAGARINKQKLRGVFRNVTRTVSRGFEKSSVTNVASL